MLLQSSKAVPNDSTVHLARVFMGLREAPWTAVAAATAFLPPPLAPLPDEPKAKAVAAATAVQDGLRPHQNPYSVAHNEVNSIVPNDAKTAPI